MLALAFKIFMFECVENNIIETPPQWVKTTDNVSSVIFSVGFVLNRIKDLPLGQFSKVLAAGAMSGFAFANALQTISSRYYHCNGDSTFANLFTLSSLVGTVASIGILIQPQAWLIWIWLFVLNNALWYCAEYYRSCHTSTFPKLNYEAKSYLNYVQWLVIATISSSICYTLSYYLPCFASPLFYIGLATNYLATITAFLQLTTLEDINARKKI